VNSLNRDLVEGEPLYVGGHKFFPESGFGMRRDARGSAVFGTVEGYGYGRVDGMCLSERPLKEVSRERLRRDIRR